MEVKLEKLVCHQMIVPDWILPVYWKQYKIQQKKNFWRKVKRSMTKMIIPEKTE